MYTSHAIQRMQQRGIPQATVEIILSHGRSYFSHGHEVFYLPAKTLRQLTWASKTTAPSKLRPVYVVLGRQGEVVTVAHKISKRYMH